MMLYTRSTPTLTPTHGTGSFFPCPAASENMPTRLSYRPPPAIEPTPTVLSSGPSSALPSLLFFDLDLESVTFLEAGTEGSVEMEGGAETSVMAS